MKNTLLLLLIQIPVFVFSQNHLLHKVSVSEQVERANIVSEGKVTFKKSYWDSDHKNIYTVYTIEVSKTYKGSDRDELHIVTLGGIVGLKAEIARPSLQLKVNEAGVFIADLFPLTLEGFDTSVPLYKTIGATQGFYRYNTETAGVTNPFLSFSNYEILDDTLQKLVGNAPKQIRSVDYFNTSKKKIRFQTNAVLNPTAISAISPTQIVAGNKSVLTISGSGFGTSLGVVRFENADDAGDTNVDALETQIVSWSDTEIQVEVPGNAGSGMVEVETDLGVKHQFGGLVVTHAYVTINYADTNMETNIKGGKEVEYRPFHIGSVSDLTTSLPLGNFDNNAYVFQYHTDFQSNTNAVNSFEDGFDPIICGAGRAFKISTTTTTAKNADDNINSISFDSVDTGILGQVVSRFYGVYFYDATNTLTIYWCFVEMDYVFNSNITWDFDLDGNTTYLEYDFNTVIRHETGHASGLGHVIDNQKIMHYALTTGPQQNITSNSIFSPVITKINEDKAVSPPSNITKTDFSSCYTLSLDKHSTKMVVAYPNPGTDTMNLSSQYPIENAILYDVRGRRLIESTKENGETPKNITLDISHLSQGVYFLTITNTKGSQTLQFIKNNTL